jgi:collagen type I/II/III/V/XI/XXIV/XXVII alpha
MANYTVTTASGNANVAGSLGYEIAKAEASGAPQIISFASSLNGHTIIPSSTLVITGGNVTVDGAGKITLSGGGAETVLQVDKGATVDLDGLTITKGTGTGSSGNYAAPGGAAAGGIFDEGDLTLSQTYITDDKGSGGQGYATGSYVGGYGGGGAAGGVYVASGAFLNLNSTDVFSGNAAYGGEGGEGGYRAYGGSGGVSKTNGVGDKSPQGGQGAYGKYIKQVQGHGGGPGTSSHPQGYQGGKGGSTYIRGIYGVQPGYTYTGGGGGGGGGDAFADYGGEGTIVHEAVCFTPDVLILTDRGEVRVAELQVGDKVVTLSDELQPIVWIGRQTILAAAQARPNDVLPIRIKAGALEDNVPVRDLIVSPGHAIYIEANLVPARYLINGVSIVREETRSLIRYFHFELPEHGVVFADGAPAETYLDTGNRAWMHALDHADVYLRDVTCAAKPCFPLIEEGEELARLRMRLLDRLGGVWGMVETKDPDLHLLVNGRIVRPSGCEDGIYSFELAGASNGIRIVSRISVPAEVYASSSDTRCLGVGLAAIELRTEALSFRLQHNHPGLAEGFHEAEACLRWTNGDASLPSAILNLLGDGRATLYLHVVGQLAYRVIGEGGHAQGEVPVRMTAAA